MDIKMIKYKNYLRIKIYIIIEHDRYLEKIVKTPSRNLYRLFNAIMSPIVKTMRKSIKMQKNFS